MKNSQPRPRGRPIVRTVDPGLQLAIEAMGGSFSALARELGLAPQAVRQWNKVPTHRILAVEKVSGVPREKLRRDLYRAPRPRNKRGIHYE